MANNQIIDTEDVQKNPKVRRKKKSQFNEVWGRLKKNKRAMVSLSVIVLLFGLAIFADIIANYDLLVVKQKITFPIIRSLVWHGPLWSRYFCQNHSWNPDCINSGFWRYKYLDNYRFNPWFSCCLLWRTS
jgi:hypothetical protein